MAGVAVMSNDSSSSSLSMSDMFSTTSEQSCQDTITAQTTPSQHGPSTFADNKLEREHKRTTDTPMPDSTKTAEGTGQSSHLSATVEEVDENNSAHIAENFDEANLDGGPPLNDQSSAAEPSSVDPTMKKATNDSHAEDSATVQSKDKSKPRLLDEADEFWGTSKVEEDKRKELMAYISYLERRNSRLEFDTNFDPYEALPVAEPETEWKYELCRERIVQDPSGMPAYPKDDIGELEEQTMRAQATGGPIMKRTREFDSKSQLLDTKIEFRSPMLVAALREAILAEEHPEFVMLHSNPVVFNEPYMLLFHYWTDIVGKRDASEGEQKAHLDFLLLSLEHECPSIAKFAKELTSKAMTTIPFDASWLLYRPGTTVFSRREGPLRAYVVDSVSGCKKLPKGSFTPLQLGLRNSTAGVAGKGYVQTHSTGTMEVFAADAKISDLDYVPAGFLPNESTERDQLIGRGTRYAKLTGTPQVMEYRGNEWKKTWEEDTSRVVIDVSMAMAPPRARDEPHQDHMDPYSDPYMYTRAPYTRGACKCPICTGYDPSNPPKWDADVHLYLPPDISAFSLVRKEWRSVAIDELVEPVFEETMMSKKLVIPQGHREIVTSLVSSYTSGNLRFSDFVKGKGRGLVILLHGSPGTGKTLTAECVAEEAKRPLYAITCGDLGVESTTLERQLRDIFDRATKWNAVLLLDEADVFLQERDIRNLERNALVSVFLRELEYFDGILFLTTNRPGQLDEAFQSRIHITLSMSALNMNAQLKIWKTFLEAELSDEKALLQCLREIKKETKESPLNGRQIRNCVRSALSLAAQQKTTVSIGHIRQVLELTKKFSEYMKELHHGQTGDERQLFLGLRK